MPTPSATLFSRARTTVAPILVVLLVLGALGLGAPTPARAASSLRCTPGYEYAVTLGGELIEVAPDGSLHSLGTWPRSNSVNGLGVTVGGTRVLALDRAGAAGAMNEVTVLTYDPPTGTFTRTADRYKAHLNGNILGAAIDLPTGDLYFGGFEAATHAGANEFRFQLFVYRAATRAFEALGYVWAGVPSTAGTANGDLSFDNDGNLFIVRGGVNETNLVVVAEGALASASGGEIAAQRASTFQGGLSGTNGLDFDNTGNAYLGNLTTIAKFDPTTWTNKGTVTTGLTDSVDLASCLAPPTLTAAASVDARNAPGDQFGLTLYSGTSAVIQTTTTGSASGLQQDRVGPLPVLVGNAYTAVETAAGTTDLADYRTTWACTASIPGTAGTMALSSGAGTTAAATIPSTSGASDDRGARVACRFTNVLKPRLTMVKAFDIRFGGPSDASAWQLTAALGSLTTTFSSGQAKGLAPGTYALGEVALPGYTLTSVVCTDAAGKVVTSGAGRALTLADGQRVTCTLTNADQPGSVTWHKTDGMSGATVGGAVFTLTGPGGAPTDVSDNTGQVGYSGADTDARPGVFHVGGLAWGVYTLTEKSPPDGYRLATASTTVTIAASALDVAAADVQDERILTFGLEKYSYSDRGQASPMLLGGAAFELRVDDHGHPGAVVAGVLHAGTQPGRFSLTDIAVGTYWLVETATPNGYAPPVAPIALAVRHDAAHPDGAIEVDPTNPLATFDASSRTLRIWDARVVALPSAGGPGTALFTGIGVAVLGLTAFLWLRAYRRRRRSHSDPTPPTPTSLDTQKAEGL
ncbi:MAG: surface-anchored fimbrial subunit [Microbacterium sp.]|jgi:hypothetical protein|nr:surface-anchored fimbrial subunit [Microbacterium sp.]